VPTTASGPAARPAGRPTARTLGTVLALLVGLVLPLAGSGPAAAATPCTTTPTAGYTVQVCVTVSDGVLSGTVPVSSTVVVWPAAGSSAPGVKRVTFSWRGGYLLSDYDADGSGRWSMQWRTDRLVDSTGSLVAKALLTDGTTYAASVPTAVYNGGQAPFVSGRRFAVSSGTTPEPGKPFRLVAVGDGADGSTREATVASQIASWQPNLLAYLGDVYARGSAYEYDNWYSSPDGFGRFRDITNPVLGNHEYHTPGAAGFFDYWGQNTPHYYSYDVAGWHVVALDSTGRFGQLQPGTPQYDWLAADLGANRARCTIAYFHHPRYSISEHKGKTSLSAVWRLLADRRVTLALAGHTHSYERWAALDRDGVPSERGVTQLIAGAGGHEALPPVYSDGRVQKYAAVPGALQLDLLGDRAEFAYRSDSGEVVDSGSVGCKSTGDTLPPTRPAGVDATTTSETTATLSWAPSTDQFDSVAGYRVRRNGRLVATVDGGTTSWTDSALVSGATYVWTVDAYDPSENVSAQSVPTSVTMPSPPRPRVKAKKLLAGLRGAGETPRGYRRPLFGGWADADGDGCSTRAEVLVTEARRPPLMTETCGLSGGRWVSPWNGVSRSDLSLLGIAPAVPLAEAWQSGARRWSPATRRALTNDLGYTGSLTAVTNTAIAARGSAEPRRWLPSRKAARCGYVAQWVAVKWRWRLSVDTAERSFLRKRLTSCGSPTVVRPARATVRLR
jgi:hypothetical protein